MLLDLLCRAIVLPMWGAFHLALEKQSHVLQDTRVQNFTLAYKLEVHSSNYQPKHGYQSRYI